ncbi:hypothetical protein OKW38_001468 [Paraburkholderia sp. MM5496-R1]
MGGRHLDAFEHADAIREKRQRPLRGDLRIELPQAARRRVARVREFALFGAALAFVQALEIALEHQHFAAHVEHARHALTLQLQRNRADRADVFGDVLAGCAVTARGSLHEHAVDVAQRDREAVEFQLGRVVDGNRRLARVVAERVADALVERDDVFVGETVVQRQHRQIVHDRLETARGLAADALRRRIRHDQIGMLGLDALQLLEQLVVLGVRQVRLIEHVIRVVRAFEFRAQPHGPLGRSADCGRRDGGSGHAVGSFSRRKSDIGLSQEACPFTSLNRGGPRCDASRKRRRPHIVRPSSKTRRTLQQAYWLNRRRVAGEPAGIPACSSFAYSVINCFSIASSALSGSGRRPSSTTRPPMRSASDFA